MRRAGTQKNWGAPPWRIASQPQRSGMPSEVDVAIIGGGFSGLAAGAWLVRLAPEKKVVVLEADRIGAGASGRTGGVALAETAVGDLPGLGDVLDGFRKHLDELQVECELNLSGAWEIGRHFARRDSPIEWKDHGTLRVIGEVAGGTVDAGKLLSGLAAGVERRGGVLCELAQVESVVFDPAPRLQLGSGEIHAGQVIFATNAFSLELSGLAGRAESEFTLALATGPLADVQLEALGLGERKPFYTVDLPYLWGRLLSDHRVMFGSGLVHAEDWRDLDTLNIERGQTADLLAWLERRVRGLHPVLRDVEITHRWGGPILFGEGWQPIFSRHPQSDKAIVLGAYAGHGVALSVYLGCWAAEVLLERKELPAWGQIGASPQRLL